MAATVLCTVPYVVIIMTGVWVRSRRRFPSMPSRPFRAWALGCSESTRSTGPAMANS